MVSLYDPKESIRCFKAQIDIFASQNLAEKYYGELFARDWITDGLEPDLSGKETHVCGITFRVLSREESNFVVLIMRR